MVCQETGKESLSELYPDIINLGGLNNAVNEAFKNLGSRLEADLNIEKSFFYSRIEYKERSSQILLAVNERLFLVDLWCEGICYGDWRFNDLIQAADFIKYFVEAQFSVREMKKIFIWFDSKTGNLHEKGAKKEIEQRWNDIISRIKKETTFMKYLLPCIKTTKKFAELNVLFPYLSMNTLCFSLTTGYPYLTIGPQITASEEYIEVWFDEDEYRKIYSVKELEKYLKQNIVYYGIARQGTAGSLKCVDF